ncbi:hypothetical protein TeGR_g5817, partial [Tetraparma gracilis]
GHHCTRCAPEPVNMKYVGMVCDATKKADMIYDYSPGDDPGKKPIAKLFGKADKDAEMTALNIAMAEATGVKHYIFN